MMEIPLTRGMVAVIDDCDYESVARYKWCALVDRGGSCYAVGNWRGGKRNTRMHRFILGITDDNVLVDHKNRNTLDNRRSNLRVATYAENVWNSKPVGASRFKGVCFHKLHNKWTARVCANGGRVNIGYYDHEWLAAFERDQVARKLHGEFTYLNYNIT